MLEPKEIEVGGKTYIVYKFPAMQGVLLAGRVPVVMDPMFLDEAEKKRLWSDLFKFVAVPVPSGNPIVLSTETLIDNHVGSWKNMHAIFKELMEHNEGFLAAGD